MMNRLNTMIMEDGREEDDDEEDPSPVAKGSSVDKDEPVEFNQK